MNLISSKKSLVVAFFTFSMLLGCNSGKKGDAKKDETAAAVPAPQVVDPCASTGSTASTNTASNPSPSPSSGGGVFLASPSPSPSTAASTAPSTVTSAPCGTVSGSTGGSTTSGSTVPSGTTPPSGIEDLLNPASDCQNNVWRPTHATEKCHRKVTKIAGCDLAKAKQIFIDKGIAADTVNAAFTDKMSGGYQLFQCGKADSTNDPYVNFILKSSGKIEERYICMNGSPVCT